MPEAPAFHSLYVVGPTKSFSESIAETPELDVRGLWQMDGDPLTECEKCVSPCMLGRGHACSEVLVCMD